MDRRSLAIMIVLAMSLPLLLAPAGEADAEPRTDTMSHLYITHGTVEWKEGYTSYHTDTLYFNEGSANHSAMLQYLEDSRTSVTADDRDHLGGKVHLYEVNGSAYEEIRISVRSGPNVVVDAETVKEPFNNTFLVKAGDTFTLNVLDARDMFGDSCRIYLGNTLLDGTYIETANTTKEIGLRFDSGRSTEYQFMPLFCTIQYEASGHSEPNGSATSFVVLCAVVAVIGLGLLIIASMKPKWSR